MLSPHFRCCNAGIGTNSDREPAKQYSPFSSSCLQAVRAALPPYRNMVDAVKQIAREEGLSGFYRGLGPSLLLVRCNLFPATKHLRQQR